MIRILLSLAVAAAAYFGPWFVDAEDRLGEGSLNNVIDGKYYAESTVLCATEMNFSIEGDCAPQGDLLGKMVVATVGLGVISAVIGIVGLIPLVGRITSIVTLLAGLVGVVTFGLFAKDLMTSELGASLTQLRWGAYATAGFGLLTVFAGLAGMRGDGD